MNPGEKKAAKKIARIMRAVRKQNGLNQIEVSKRLAISQSALSKYEAGSIIPSAHLWVEFCNFTRVPVNSYLDGFIDHQKEIHCQDIPRVGNFRLPTRFSYECGSSVRSTVPFLKYFVDRLGEKALHAYLKSVKMDPDFFTIMDNSLNLNFNLDMVRHLIKKGVLLPKDIPILTLPMSDQSTHGKLHEVYDQVRDPVLLLGKVIDNSNRYDCNTKYKIDDCTKTTAVISVTPEPHMKDFDYMDPVLSDFLCRYKKSWFQAFSRYGDPTVNSEIKELQCHFSGADQCLYQMTLTH